MLSRRLLLLAACCFVYVASETGVSVHYILHCGHQYHFNYNIKIKEEDAFGDDLIAEHHSSGRRYSEGIVSGVDNIDGDDTFEFYVQIVHNCGGVGKVQRLRLDPLCDVTDDRCDYVINVNL